MVRQVHFCPFHLLSLFLSNFIFVILFPFFFSAVFFCRGESNSVTAEATATSTASTGTTTQTITEKEKGEEAEWKVEASPPVVVVGEETVVFLSNAKAQKNKMKKERVKNYNR